MIPLFATTLLDQYRAEQDAKKDAYLSSYIQEHGYLPSIWYYDSWSRWFMLIGFIAALILMRHLLFTISYTKQLIEKGNIELKSKLRNMYSIVALIIVVIISMGVYTAFKYSYPGYLVSVLAGLLIGVFISRHSKRNIREYHSLRDIPYPKENEVSNDMKDPNKNININESESSKIKTPTLSDMKKEYLDRLKSYNRDIQFRELVRLNFTGNNVDSIVNEMAVVSTTLSPDVMPLTESIISKWVDLSKKKGFWNLNGSRLFDLFDKEARAILDSKKVEYNDNDIEYLFQYLLLVLAGSALNDIESRKFMGIE